MRCVREKGRERETKKIDEERREMMNREERKTKKSRGKREIKVSDEERRKINRGERKL